MLIINLIETYKEKSTEYFIDNDIKTVKSTIESVFGRVCVDRFKNHTSYYIKMINEKIQKDKTLFNHYSLKECVFDINSINIITECTLKDKSKLEIVLKYVR